MIDVISSKSKLRDEFRSDYIKANKLYGITIDLTQACNYDCLFCFKENVNKRNHELSTSEIKRVLLEVRELGCYSIQFTGGEPLLRKDIFEILKYAKKLHFFVTLNTNASLLNEESIIEISNLRIDEIICSLHSLDNDNYKKIMGTNEDVSKIKNSLIQLKAQKINVWINAILTKYNIDEMKKMKEEFSKYDIEVSNSFLNLSQNSYKNVSILAPSNEQLISYLKVNKKNKKEYENKKNSVCGVGKSSFVIMSNGDI